MKKLIILLILLSNILLLAEKSTTNKEVIKKYDSSIKVVFKKPVNYLENEKLAQKFDLMKYYEVFHKGKTLSTISVNVKNKNKTTLEKFIQKDMYTYHKRFQKATFQKSVLPEKIMKKFEDISSSLNCFIYKSESKDESNAIVLFFETKEAFWTISWNSVNYLFEKAEVRDSFLYFLNDIKIKKQNS